ncbi:MAG: HlyD family type I secretion periplasmic adaptor subunit [Nitrosomonadales bacterium]
MEPANKSSIGQRLKAVLAKIGGTKKSTGNGAALDFLPDADEIERRPLPPVARITLHVFVTALVIFILWATFSEVDRIVVARGRLVTPLPNLVVQPLETSIIQSIDVRIGQVVKKGERLATLDPTFSEADEAELQTRLHSLDNQLAEMNDELAGKKHTGPASVDADTQLQTNLSEERHANYSAQVLKLAESVSRLRASQETNRHDQQGLASRVKVLQEMESTQQDLVDNKYAVRSRLLDVEDRLLEAQRSLEMAKNRQIEIARELASLEAEKLSFETGWRQKMMEDLLAASRERDAVNEQLQKASKRHELVILTAPIDAVVLDIAKLSQGSVVQSAEKLFTLVPIGADLEAEVQIDAQDVGYVKVGDTAHIKFDAFPFQKHGTLVGELRTISEDAFRNEPSTSSSLDAYYKGRIHFKSARLKKMPESGKLLPGMTVAAEIVVGKRSVMSYLLWPLLKASDEAISEP